MRLHQVFLRFSLKSVRHQSECFKQTWTRKTRCQNKVNFEKMVVLNILRKNELHKSIMMMMMVMMIKKYVLMFSHMQNLPNLLLLGYCMCLTVLHVSMHVSSVPTWFACLVNHSMEVPLACLRRGGQVMTLNQVNLSFEKMCGNFDLSLNCCMCGHGSTKTSACSACPSSIQLLCICHLTVAMAKINTQLVLEYIAAMGDDAYVMRQLDRESATF